LLFQQNGLLQTKGRSKAFVKALATGRFPREEIDKFVNGEQSLVDEFIRDQTQTLEALDTANEKSDIRVDFLDSANELVDEVEEQGTQELPIVETKDVLASLAG
jgi:hypothetical protein